MSKTLFTPGPWMANGMKVCDSEYFTIAKCGWLCQSDEESEANVALIATAPELYEALQEAVSELCSNHSCEPCEHTNKDHTECSREPGKCFVQRWINLLKKARGEA